MAVNKYEELSQERKQLQRDGLLPEWFTTGSWQLFKNKYLYGDNPKKHYTRIAKTLASHMKDSENWEAKFFNLLWKGWVSPSTPVLSNTGTTRGLPISCAGNYIDDSVGGFYSSLLENSILTKHGFGTSSYLGAIRPRGSKISTGGYAQGVLPVLEMNIQMSKDVSQGGVRRGAWAGYIEIDHGDFWEVYHRLKNNPDDCNIGWIISDSFIERLDEGDDDAIERYQSVLQLKNTFGKGYFHFSDKVNRLKPETYKKHGLDIKASNLCLSSDTMIDIIFKRDDYETFDEKVRYSEDERYFHDTIRISSIANHFANDLSDIKVRSFNIETNEIEYRQLLDYNVTGRNVKTIVISDSRGHFSLECTDNHEIYTKNRGYVQAKDINSDDILLVNNSPDFIIERSGFKIVAENVSDVWDMTVEHNHNMFADNILVHNCDEIQLHSSPEYTFTCCLSSMNLAKYDEWKDTDAIFDATVFLDCVISEFLERAKDIPHLEKAIAFTEKGRALGLGVMGLFTHFQQEMIDPESIDAHILNTKIFQQLDKESMRASKWLASEYGEPEWCEGFGYRNTTRLAIAPTKSTGAILGGVSEGINPIFSNVFISSTSAGDISRINPTLLGIMKERGVYNQEVIQSIEDNNGSVKHVDWLNEEEKKVFKTSFELNQFTLLKMASVRQRYIDQGQSLNLFIIKRDKGSEEFVSDLHEYAFRDNYIKGMYYIYSDSASKAERSSKNNQNNGECESCQ